MAEALTRVRRKVDGISGPGVINRSHSISIGGGTAGAGPAPVGVQLWAKVGAAQTGGGVYAATLYAAPMTTLTVTADLAMPSDAMEAAQDETVYLINYEERALPTHRLKADEFVPVGIVGRDTSNNLWVGTLDGVCRTSSPHDLDANPTKSYERDQATAGSVLGDGPAQVGRVVDGELSGTDLILKKRVETKDAGGKTVTIGAEADITISLASISGGGAAEGEAMGTIRVPFNDTGSVTYTCTVINADCRGKLIQSTAALWAVPYTYPPLVEDANVDDRSGPLPEPPGFWIGSAVSNATDSNIDANGFITLNTFGVTGSATGQSVALVCDTNDGYKVKLRTTQDSTSDSPIRGVVWVRWFAGGSTADTADYVLA